MNIIFKPFNGKENHPHLVEAPEKPNVKPEDGYKWSKAMDAYDSLIRLAIANAVPFHEEDDIREVTNECWYSETENLINPHEDYWTPKTDKIYSVEGKYEIYEYPLMKVSWETEEMFQDRLKNGKRIKFAVLLKEETIKEPEKVESQGELWRELLDKDDTDYNQELIKEAMSKFRISRIKPE